MSDQLKTRFHSLPAQLTPLIGRAQEIQAVCSLLRQVEVLHLLAGGLTDLQIAEQLVLRPHTIHAHISSIYSKLAVTSRSAATRYAIEHHQQLRPHRQR